MLTLFVDVNVGEVAVSIEVSRARQLSVRSRAEPRDALVYEVRLERVQIVHQNIHSTGAGIVYTSEFLRKKKRKLTPPCGCLKRTHIGDQNTALRLGLNFFEHTI